MSFVPPWTQELEVITLAATALLSKYRKMATFDEFLDRLFFHGKAAVTVLLFLVGVAHVVSYLIAWIGEFRMCFSFAAVVPLLLDADKPYPPFTNSANSEVKKVKGVALVSTFACVF